MSPLRGNSSRGMRCVVPGKGGSRTSSPEVPLGSSGSIGGFVCIGDAPQMGVADSRTPRAQNQGRKAQPSRRDLADRAPATTHVDPCRGTRSWCTEAHASRGPRDAAAYLLNQRFGESARQRWRAAIDSGDEGRAPIAVNALAYAAEEDIERLTPFLRHSAARIRSYALRGLVRAKSRSFCRRRCGMRAVTVGSRSSAAPSWRSGTRQVGYSRLSLAADVDHRCGNRQRGN
jgi:hypothetical protein